MTAEAEGWGRTEGKWYAAEDVLAEKWRCA